MENNNKEHIRGPFFLFLMLISVSGLLMLMSFISTIDKKANNLEYSDFIKAVTENRIDFVTFEGDKDISGMVKDVTSGKLIPFKTVGDTRSDFYLKILNEHHIVPNYKQETQPNFLLVMVDRLFPIFIVIIIGLFFLSRIQKGGINSAKGLTNFKSGSLMKTNVKTRFKDVAGVDEAKEELSEIVEFLKTPRKFVNLGGRLPKGVLLVGPPGTGKTLMAKAVAGEADVPFFSISGSNFVEIFVGVGASRVRSLFEQAKDNAPCIVFIDEIDSIGRHRSAGNMSGSNDEREQTLNQLLVEMDGFDSNSGIIVIAATNRPDVLDSALLRPGRFDRRVFLTLPDIKGREDILKAHTVDKPLSRSVRLDIISRGTAGMSGAELENLVNEAAIIAGKKNKEEIETSDFEMAKDKVIMGVERKSLIISDEEKKVTAYHEAGHTLISKLIKGLDPLHKVSIIPRGQALGVTQMLPTENRLNLTKEKAEKMIVMFMGGRVAEELIFNHITTGASNDIERASQLARRMVCEWGMSDKMGPIAFNDLTQKNGEPVFYSPQLLKIIEDEISDIVGRNYKEAKRIISENIDSLHLISQALIKKETLDNDEINALLKNQTV
jgi:cell division protease FtsH